MFAVVIFGARLYADGSPRPVLTRRIDRALQVAHADRVLYMPTGGAVGQRQACEADVMAALLQAGGVPAQAIVVERKARDTLESALFCHELLKESGLRPAYDRVVLVSSAYHLPRCWILMRLQGWRRLELAAPRVAASRSWHKRWFWRFRELPAIAWDVLLLLKNRGGGAGPGF